MAGIKDLAARIEKLASMPRCCVIRGTFVGEERAAKSQHAGRYTRKKINFDDAPLHWVMLDINGFEDPSWSILRMPTAPQIEKFIATKLPPAFKGRATTGACHRQRASRAKRRCSMCICGSG